MIDFKIAVNKSKVTFITDGKNKVTWELKKEHLDLTLSEYTERFIKPACLALAGMEDKQYEI